MNTEWKRDAQHIRMILSGEDLASRESWPFRVLSENRIPGLLPCAPSQIDQETRLYFDLSGRHSLRDVMEIRSLDHQLLGKLLAALAAVCENLEEYLLAPEGLLLMPDRVFLDMDGSRIGFCYYPGREIPFDRQLKDFAESLLPWLDQQDKTAVVMGYGLYQRSMTEELPGDILRDLLRGTRPEAEPAPVTREELEQSALLDAFFAEEEEDSVFRKAGGRIRGLFRKGPENREDPGKTEGDILRPLPAGRGSVSAGSSRELSLPEPDDGPQTSLLQGPLPGGMPAGRARLRISLPDGRLETVQLEKDRYLIGQTDAGAEIGMPSPAVSRMHACLEKKESTFYLRDLHSRNGTRVNGEELLPEETRALADGDTLQFADITCRYQRI